MNPQGLDAAAELIAQADALVIAAGAGLGVDSGLPDFRGREGFWRAYPALGRAGLDFTQVASPLTFERDPELAWGFYGHRLALYRRTVPHAGFALLRQWADRKLHGGAVFTSNVDGQFQRAGFKDLPLHECHGSLHWLQCLEGCGQPPWPAEALQPEVDEDACRWRGPLPACPGCGGLARPNLLMFGDWGWAGERYQAQATRLSTWLARAERPVVVEIGAGTAVPSVRHFSQLVVAAHGGRIVRINPRDPAVAPAFGVGLALGAVEATTALEARLGSA
ncbi:MAG: NAD-dependent deacetylase [Proteobacteria bacterium]|jgi:NAD-dependent SIR2 family protein deacetylase|nr:NAD-dependent deacetylase [Methylibium sp.]MCH8855747.1 NAD-dependent deacetylase [Pseudomonadota bacterium]|mmetsp:Transcript_22395/g.88658  ORF Transcript_22395/g.88658 Transcript_22395/m.88658 type:complete len:278 (-) Transcript_22395:1674-2507(-)